MKISLAFLVAVAFTIISAKELSLKNVLQKLEEREGISLRELTGSELEKRGTTNGKLTSSQKTEILDAHNNARRNVSPTAANMVEMEWDYELETTAQNYAQTCIWGHNSQRSSQSPSYSYVGENLYLTTGTLSPSRGVTNWDNEKKDYTYSSASCSGVCGHYTQVVWSSSTKLGCASYKCPYVTGLSGWSDVTILVCNYGPGGNYIGKKPYQSGSQCSACPSGTSCVNGLCSSGGSSGTSNTDNNTSSGSGCKK